MRKDGWLSTQRTRLRLPAGVPRPHPMPAQRHVLRKLHEPLDPFLRLTDGYVDTIEVPWMWKPRETMNPLRDHRQAKWPQSGSGVVLWSRISGADRGERHS